MLLPLALLSALYFKTSDGNIYHTIDKIPDGMCILNNNGEEFWCTKQPILTPVTKLYYNPDVIVRNCVVVLDYKMNIALILRNMI